MNQNDIDKYKKTIQKDKYLIKNFRRKNHNLLLKIDFYDKI